MGDLSLSDIPDLQLPDWLQGGGGGDAFDLSMLDQFVGGGAGGGGYQQADWSFTSPLGDFGYQGSTGIIPPVAGKVPSVLSMLRASLPKGITVKAFLGAVAKLGLAAAARAVGVAPQLAAQAFISARQRPRRGRGITGRQLRTTGNVLRKLGSMNRRVHAYVSAGGFARHRTSSPPAQRRSKANR